MTHENLTEIYQLAVEGIGFGFVFSSLPFLVGFIVNFTMGLFKHAS